MQIKQRKKYTRRFHSDDLDSVVFGGQLGNKIKSLRLSYGLSRQVVAIYLECSHQQVAKYETGANRLSVYKALKLCDLFKVYLEDLVSFDSKDYTDTKSKRLLATMRAYEKLPESSQKLVTNYIKLIKKIN